MFPGGWLPCAMMEKVGRCLHGEHHGLLVLAPTSAGAKGEPASPVLVFAGVCWLEQCRAACDVRQVI